MTTEQNIITELTARNIPTTGLYIHFPLKVLVLIESALHFGEHIINNSRYGLEVKKAAIKLYKADGRKSVICPVTFKNILK